MRKTSDVYGSRNVLAYIEKLLREVEPEDIVHNRYTHFEVILMPPSPMSAKQMIAYGAWSP
jgi:hypothetical protein